MSDAAKQHELLTAYFDNELGATERAQAESLIRNDPESAQLIQRWRENANAIAELPRYKLNDQFANRVLATLASQSPERQLAAAHSESTDWRIGLGAIASLAAMLLLTLFVFPRFGNSGLNPESVASNEPPVVESSSTGPVQPRVVTPNISLPGSKSNGQPVAPIELLNLMNRPAGAEQILWIEQGSLIDVAKTFEANAISLDQDLVAHSQNGIEALYVLTTGSKMKQAIGDLTNRSKCKVQAFPLPGETSAAEDAPGNQQIIPVDLLNDAEEIASLDEWFGLAANDDHRLIKFLIFVNTSTEK